MAAGHDVSHL